MTSAQQRLLQEYQQSVESYLQGQGERALERAYEAGREAMERGLGPLDMMDAHLSAVTTLLEHAKTLDDSRSIVPRALEVFRDSLTAFEMAHRAYQDANAALLTANEKLAEANAQLAQKNAEIERSAAIIRDQNEALLRAQQQKEQLTALVVHDLKNPIAGIALNAKFLVRDPSVAPNHKQSAEGILKSADAMNRMVMNLLDISRSEDGALVARRSTLDLRKLFADIRETMSIRAKDVDQVIDTEITAGIDRIDADPDLLRRTLENLVENAIRYSRRSGRILLEARRGDGGSVEIRVRDEGQGVPEEYRERIFEKYVQGPGDARVLRTGRGLGLVFCRLATQAQGGAIWVESNEPQGSVFALRLPG